jgi:hypothetical protein
VLIVAGALNDLRGKLMEVIFEQIIDLLDVLTGFLIYGKPVKVRVVFDRDKKLWVMSESRNKHIERLTNR